MASPDDQGTATAPPRGDVALPSLATLAAPTGGGAILGIGETFQHNAVTGACSIAIPVGASPGRGGFGPNLSLVYDSGGGNGPFGLGWRIDLSGITRKTDKGLPRYLDAIDSDIFLLGGAEDLAPVLDAHEGRWTRVVLDRALGGQAFRVERYRPRVEAAFTHIERWRDEVSGETHWRTITRDNITTLFGLTAESRIADPADSARVFSWLPARSWNDRGDAIEFRYRAEDDEAAPAEAGREARANRYLKTIHYAAAHPFDPAGGESWPNLWRFQLVLDYGDHDEAAPRVEPDRPWNFRPDPFSSYRSGFEIRTRRLCRRLLMFHAFPEFGETPLLVRSTDLRHDRRPEGARLVGATRVSYLRNPVDGGYSVIDPKTGEALSPASMPAVEFDYAPFLIDATPRSLDPGAAASADNARTRWVDLDGEGLPGLLFEQRGAWLYRRNASEGAQLRFDPLHVVARRPTLAQVDAGRPLLLDIDGDGHMALVQYARPMAGYQERNEADWRAFRPFPHMPDLDFDDPNLQFVDLDGDGFVDILISEDDAFVWYRSLARGGFEPARRVPKPRDEDRGPSLIFADGTLSLHLADMSGDGLADLVRVRNSEVAYWPNLGHGRFGPRVAMSDAPVFDLPDRFDPRRLRLADIDGSGATDIIYLGPKGAQCYLNLSGNGWSPAHAVETLPPHCPPEQVEVLDLLGRGTACLVWSSPLPGDASRPLRYIDLTRGWKPYLLTTMRNGMGAETRITYAPSTQFYMRDREAGRPWATKLPFPVHVVERVETIDHINHNRFVSRHAYRHGFYDGVERDFRGFGLLETWDGEEIGALGEGEAAGAELAPVLTRTWFHTGADLQDGRISRIFADEYWRPPGAEAPWSLEESEIPAGLSLEAAREARRALRGAVLRREVYAQDGSEAAERPYYVSESRYAVRLLQPFGPNPHAAFLTHVRETLSAHYEREALADPRVLHGLVLAVDDYGSVTERADIAYGRTHADPALDAADQAAQRRAHVTWSHTRMTNAVLRPDAYRAPLPCETTAWEVRNLPLTRGQPVRLATLRRELERAADGRHDLPCEDVEGTAATDDHPWRRLIGRAGVYFRADDLSITLPLGRLEPRGLPGRSLTLTLTSGLVASLYGDRVSGDMLAKAAGYRHSEGDADWWAPSAEMFYSENPADRPGAELAEAQRHFFLPRRMRDPFGNIATARYDAHDLLLIETRDALGNQMTAGERDPAGRLLASGLDYRVLLPRLVMDHNRNRSAFAFDIHGMVVATAAMGKPEEQLGDSIDGLEPDTPASMLREAARHPLDHAAALLGQATTRIVYDLFAYQRTRREAQPQPAMAWTLARETHVSDLPPGEQTRIMQRFDYSDGFGRVIQAKVIAEPSREAPHEPRWIGDGWTVFDNRANPVRRYEPFFSAAHRFEFARIEGVSPTLIYDPLGRAIATLHPDHSWEKIVVRPWQQDAWDRNDTVLADVRQDADVGGLIASLPVDLTQPSWYAARIEGRLGEADRDAARNAAVHAATPATTHLDASGRPILAIARNRTLRDGAIEAASFHTRTVLDILGSQLDVIDPLGRLTVRAAYDLRRAALRTESMETGAGHVLQDVNGKPVYAWDGSGNRVATRYDALRRPTETWLSAEGRPEILVARTVFGETQPDPEGRNLRGRAYRNLDSSGEVAVGAYDFKGNPLSTRRRLLANFKGAPDWATVPELEAERFDSFVAYDALNRPTQQVNPHVANKPVSCVQPVYDRAGMLLRVDLWEGLTSAPDKPLPPHSATLQPLADARYNARGQRTHARHGNGAHIAYDYDPLTFRLLWLRTERDGERLQALGYVYDPVGNVAATHDDAQQTLYFRNRCVRPSKAYLYDALYRLVAASGREHLGQRPGPAPEDAFDAARIGLTQPGDGQAMARYDELYHYDPVGNLHAMVHRIEGRSDLGWTRRYDYGEPSALQPDRVSDRLSATHIGREAPERYRYDVLGRMTAMPHLTHVAWDWRSRLRATSRQATREGRKAETTYYVYDDAGQRIRKVTERSGADGGTRRVRETLYLGAVEIFRAYCDHGELKLERETLHVMDGPARAAMVETRVHGEDPGPKRRVRFQYGDRLGSSVLELDEHAHISSYEEYYPYGCTSYQAVRGALEAPKRYRYAGRERDEESGFYHFLARYLAPWLGRWTSCDPAGFVDGTNLYQHARCNPISNADPSGMACDPSIQCCTDPTAPTEREESEQRSIPEEHPPPEDTSPEAPPDDTGSSDNPLARGALTINLFRFGAAQAIRPRDIQGDLLEGTFYLWSDVPPSRANRKAAQAAAVLDGWLHNKTPEHAAATKLFAAALRRQAAIKFPGQTFTDPELFAKAGTDLVLPTPEMRAIWDEPSRVVAENATLGHLPVQQNMVSPPGPDTVQARMEIPAVRKAGAIVGGVMIGTGALDIAGGVQEKDPFLKTLGIGGGSLEVGGGMVYLLGAARVSAPLMTTGLRVSTVGTIVVAPITLIHAKEDIESGNQARQLVGTLKAIGIVAPPAAFLAAYEEHFVMPAAQTFYEIAQRDIAHMLGVPISWVH